MRPVVLEVGTQRTTLKEVGERAGYSRGLANPRFGSKDGLFVKLANRCRRRWIDELQRAAVGKQGLDVLLSRFDAMDAFAAQYPDEARVMYVLWFESVGARSEINASLARFHQQARADIKALALDAGLVSGTGAEDRAERYATRFCGTSFGLCYQWLVNADAIDIRRNIADIKEEVSFHQARPQRRRGSRKRSATSR